MTYRCLISSAQHWMSYDSVALRLWWVYSLVTHTASDGCGGTTSDGCLAGQHTARGAAPVSQVSISSKSGLVPARVLAKVYT